MSEPDAHKAKPLADALVDWLNADLDLEGFAWASADSILSDAITQAAKAETIEWLASIAERYGFKPPENT